MYEPKLERPTISEIFEYDFSKYFLPSIQREFVWDEDDIKEMIESLLNGYPIGIITIFKTDLEFPIDTASRPSSQFREKRGSQ